MGRPPSLGVARSVVLCMRLTPAEMLRIEERADAVGLKPAEWLRARAFELTDVITVGETIEAMEAAVAVTQGEPRSASPPKPKSPPALVALEGGKPHRCHGEVIGEKWVRGSKVLTLQCSDPICGRVWTR